MGTRALWQSTNQTTGHGTNHSGRGRPDAYASSGSGRTRSPELGRGEAIIYTTLGPDPRRATILPVEFDHHEPKRIGGGSLDTCELRVHPEERLPSASGAAPGGDQPMGPDPGSGRI